MVVLIVQPVNILLNIKQVNVKSVLKDITAQVVHQKSFLTQSAHLVIIARLDLDLQWNAQKERIEQLMEQPPPMTVLDALKMLLVKIKGK